MCEPEVKDFLADSETTIDDKDNSNKRESKYNLRTQTFRNRGVINEGKNSKKEEESIKKCMEEIIYKVINKILKEENTSEHLVDDDNKDEFKNGEVIFTKALLENKENKVSLLTKMLNQVWIFINSKEFKGEVLLDTRKQ
jgi:hypothetical protein